jgi:hypothetical protein
MKRPVWFLSLSFPCLLTTAWAKVPDPTRPEDEPAVAEGGGGGNGRGVQMTLVPVNGQPTALIHGQYIKGGGLLDGKRILKITENEVVMRGDGGLEVIKLTPAASKVSSVKRQQRRVVRDGEKHRE